MFPLKLVCGFLLGIHPCSPVSYTPRDFYGNLVTPNPFSGLATIMYFHECLAWPCMTPKNCPPNTIPKICICFVEFPSPSTANTQKVPPPLALKTGFVPDKSIMVFKKKGFSPGLCEGGSGHMAYQADSPTRSFQKFENTQSMRVTLRNTVTKRKAREVILKTLLASGTSTAP